ncbi:acyltransferase family protein [Phenylobacterium montanum]|uniref:Acyltransferase n=1 Tax=Phenylobacterium montanum TaxID=2823693 RepID=A0A975IWR5_9CAUL|nr:acyltransferase [Caulobacter sp. S6]QUD90120.1 acyltransferase [Caulobacter sp. S6]
MTRVRSIQALRALAALSVVLYHACQWANAGFAIGAAGVDIFFVISGFVMWTTIQDPGLTPGRFVQRRFWRVAPAYWLVTAIVAAVALAAPNLMSKVYVTPSHALLSFAFIQHDDPSGVPFPLLPVGWSLNYEAIFYAIVAFALLAPARRRFGRIAGGLIGVMLLGIVPPISLFLLGQERLGEVFQKPFFLFANPMMMQFLAGVVIAKLRLERRLPRHGAGWGLVMTALIMFVVLSFFDLYASLWRPILWGTPAALLVAGAVSLEADGRVLANRLTDRLGEASYSLYLCHWPVVVILANTIGVARPALFVPLAFGSAVAAGLIYWRLVERPLARVRLSLKPQLAAEPAAS